jgi:glycosyltransferase involved in cell wall biosynthesis
VQRIAPAYTSGYFADNRFHNTSVALGGPNMSSPLVSVGIPVYNGERFLEAALDSILTQTHSNLEIIISDNASTDRTPEICKAYAARDRRIHYYRNDKNLGAARNYNLTVERASGKYFKWAAHDDVCAPTFIKRCVGVLERKPNVALAYPKTIVIDEHARIIDEAFEDKYDIRSPQAHVRYKLFTQTPLDCNAVFGVMRLHQLRNTPCIGSYESSDRVLLGELALHGEIIEVPERLFLRRSHPLISTNACKTKQSMAAWFDPTSSGKFSRLRRFLEYIRSVNRVSLSPLQRLYCYYYLLLFYERMYLDPARWGRLLDRLLPRMPDFSAPSIHVLHRKEVH